MRSNTTRSLFFMSVSQPSLKSFKKLCVFSFAFVTKPFFTTSVATIVKNKVQISIINKSRMSNFASKKPANMGEIKNFAEPASCTRPLAFENSSTVSKSVIVARYEGSSKEVKTELIVTPIAISKRLALPFVMRQIKINTSPSAESPSPKIIKIRNSNTF